MSVLDARTGLITKNFISIPIILDNLVRGGIIITNKTPVKDDSHQLYTEHPLEKKISLPSDSFGSTDEFLLEFIAANARLVWKHALLGNKKRSSFSRISLCREARIAKLYIDCSLQQLVDKACRELNADLISVFAFNKHEKQLVTVVANRNTADCISTETRLAGTSFHTAKIINVHDTASLERWNPEIDFVGFRPNSLLCAPILDNAGQPVGVMQALNKNDAGFFSVEDEVRTSQFCREFYSLLQDSDFSAENMENCHASFVAKIFARLSVSETVSCMADEIRKIITDSVVCDYVGLYTLSSSNRDGVVVDDLVCQNSGDIIGGDSRRIIHSESIPVKILDAIKLGVIREYSGENSFESARNSLFEAFTPGISIRNALIYPINSGLKLGSLDDINSTDKDDTAKRSVVIVVRSSQRVSGFTTAVRDTIDIFMATLRITIRGVIKKELQNLSMKTLEEENCFKKNMLCAVRDHVILLDPGGHFLAWNQDPQILFGPILTTVMCGNSTSKSSSSNSSSNSSSFSIVPCEGSRVTGDSNGVAYDGTERTVSNLSTGQHFSTYFTSKNCPDLFSDLTDVCELSIVGGVVCVQESAVIVSTIHPTGVTIDYQLQLVETNCEEEETKNGENLSAMNVALVIRVRDDSTAADYDHSQSGRAGLKRLLSYNALIKPENGEAKTLVESANLMLKSIEMHHLIPNSEQQKLKEVTTSLDLLVYPEQRSEIPFKSHRRESDSLRYQLVDESIHTPGNVFEWDFNVLEIMNKNVLLNVIGHVIESLEVLDTLGINRECLANYIREICEKYHENPFHNFHHATCVTHFSFMLIRATEASKYLSAEQLFGVVISAVVHDVDHPGNTNMFEINYQSKLALLYNDLSVLENHHCSTAFQLMRAQSTNILNGLSKTTSSDVRKTIISCVLATDMSVHFQLVEETKKILTTGLCAFNEVQNQLFLCKLLVHSGDLSNPVRPFHIAQAWARKISEEFNLQVALEQKLQMPVLNFMITSDDKALCKNETGFASFVVAPMWRSLSSLFPALNPLVQQLDSNLLCWKQLLDSIMKDETV